MRMTLDFYLASYKFAKTDNDVLLYVDGISTVINWFYARKVSAMLCRT